ncbi:uncharacterized protein LOC121431034 [Lytechinus variegatus]|uniref:uncharacterized protein LOC121431034 n=1 Tax=Lytechinus variegatus TaxID=7654 RepID=UPI001BB1CA2F|nr:uncharacterized protein LOC121431034 [Lytechinus variegatus]
MTTQPSYELTSDTPPTISQTWSTSEMQDTSTQKKQMTTQPRSEMTSGHITSTELHRSTRDNLASTPIATTFSSTLQPNSHSSYFGAVVGEGVVIILLSVLLMVSVIYIIRIRKMMKDSNKDQRTQHVDLVQSSNSPEKDTGFYHDIQDVMISDPSSTSDGDVHYSSQIYEHKGTNVLDPDDTSAPQYSYMI